MSTTVTITIAAAPSKKLDRAIDAAFAEMQRIEGLLSEWLEGSQLSHVIANAGGQAIEVDPEIFDVLEAGHRVSVKSNGAFDMTIGALWGAWDFRWQQPKIPSDAELAERIALIDYTEIELDRTQKTVRLAKPGMKLATGGIAKGYAVDRASAVLKDAGFDDHLIVAGGDLIAMGSKFGKPWSIGVRQPGEQSLYGKLPIENRGVATSGNYERYFVRDGVRYHHILDPKTGKPARGTSSVTVIAPTAMAADTWATAFFVMGPEAALKLANTLDGIDLLVFDEHFQVTGTRAALAAVEKL